MGEMLREKKIRLASKVLALEDEVLIDKLEKVLTSYLSDKTIDATFFARPIPEDITLEELAKQQHQTPIDKKKMDAIIAALDIEEPIEDLLRQLTP